MIGDSVATSPSLSEMEDNKVGMVEMSAWETTRAQKIAMLNTATVRSCHL